MCAYRVLPEIFRACASHINVQVPVGTTVFSHLIITMIPRFAFVSILLLASVAVSSPSSRLEARLARRRENRQSQPVNRVEVPVGTSSVGYSSNWAGEVLNEPYVYIAHLIYNRTRSHHFFDRELSPLLPVPL